MPPYPLPTLNLTCTVSRRTAPSAIWVTVASIPCQLRAPGVRSTGQDAGRGWTFTWALITSALADVRDNVSHPAADRVEVPAGSGRLYSVEIVDDVAKGFPNEYRIAFLSKVPPWPSPIP